MRLREGDKFFTTKRDGVCLPGWWVWEDGRFKNEKNPDSFPMTVHELKHRLKTNSSWLHDGNYSPHSDVVYAFEFMAEQLIAEGAI